MKKISRDERPMLRFAVALGCALMCCSIAGSSVSAADGMQISLAEGKIRLSAPEKWISKEPRFKSIVSYEFAVTAVDGDSQDGRVTIGGAGGGVTANLDRWKAQFVLADGDESLVQKKMKVADQTVHFLDLRGTYRPPPFLGQPPQSDYRMLGAIIETDKVGSYYVRFYGPQQTVAANEKAFLALIDSLKVQ